MVPIPLKAVPVLMIIGGIALVMEGGDGFLAGLIVAGLGGVWAYFMYSTPNKEKS